MKAERKLKDYMTEKYPPTNIETLMHMIQSLIKENEELKKRVDVLEKILRMHLPIIEE